MSRKPVTEPAGDIYAIPVAGRFLLWSPLKRIAACMNRSGMEMVQNTVIGGKTSGSDDHTISRISRDLREFPEHLPEKRSGRTKPVFLGIIPTRQCNLSCAYCGFGARNADEIRMDYATAVTAVTWMVETAHANGEDSVNIHFFGGEPFSAGDVVDVVVHRARAESIKAGIIPRFEVSTNGVFSRNRMRFIGEYFDAVVLSFDGHEDIHDLHRPKKKGVGSFTEVARTANGLGNTGVELCFRTCVSQLSVHRLIDISKMFVGSFSPNAVCFETLQPNAESEAAGLSQPDPFAFSAAYVHARAVLKQSVLPPINNGPTFAILWTHAKVSDFKDEAVRAAV